MNQLIKRNYELDISSYIYKVIFVLLLLIFLIVPSSSLAGGSQTFTSSGTFFVPSGVTALTVYVAGGGGAGAGGTNEGAGAGGGGGGYSSGTIAVSPGGAYGVTVGAGGYHGGAPHCEGGASSPGGDGGYSYIGGIIAYGGGGGQTGGAPGAGGWGNVAYGSYGSWPPSRWASSGGAGGYSGAGGAGGAGGSTGTAGTCTYYYNCNETSCECGAWTGGTPAVNPQPGVYYGGGGGGVWSAAPFVPATCDYSPTYAGNGAPGYVIIYWTVNPPTASASVSPNPVPYNANPGFTLSSTNAYYCYLLLDWSTYLVAGYTTSGTYYAGSFTSPGTHSISAYCYNSEWVGSGWSTTNFTVNNPPTASVSVSPISVSYGASTNVTLSSTNAYYCHVYRINSVGTWVELQSGYLTSGTWNTGGLTDPGTHYGATYCYNSSWVGSGWAYAAFTVSSAPPSINNVTISNGVVVTNAVNQYTITSTATDATGGSAITDELALINYQGVNAGTYRGYLGWSSVGFTHFGGAYKTPPIACSGGGLGAIYNGYGPQYINLISCSTSVSGNTRTVSYVVTFNTNFTSPINSNTISGYATNSSTGLSSGWSPFSAFTITPTCSNGANNYPTCNTCSTPLGWNGSICTVCSNGGCTNGNCNNGANNPVSCSTCTSPGFIWQSSTSSCIPSTPPTASIISPAVNITIYDDQIQQFTGTATDDGTVVAYEWRTSNCSTGTILSSLANFVRSFSVGTYTVYFRAQDNAGSWSTNCPSRTIQVIAHNQVAGVCGSANGVSSQKKPTSNLCNTLGLPGPTVLPVGIDTLPENNPALSWSWTCAGEYGGADTFCGSNSSCGDGKCQASKGESPARCRADCRVNFFEF
ncbi:MAG: hypothetical protein WC724_01145 [Candidatus Paceibacterota bacterium]|jgi:hypothetical protein